MEPCTIQSAEIVDVDADGRLTDGAAPCKIDQGSRFRLFYEAEIDTDTTPPPSDFPASEIPKPWLDEQTNPTPSGDIPMPENEQTPSAEHHDAPPASEVAPAQPEPEPEPQQQELQAHTTAPDPTTAASELSEIAKAAGGDHTMALGMALIAVLGGGAAWKFYQKHSEQKHEQKMKELELQAQANGLNGAQPPPCQAATLKQEQEISALKSKLAESDERLAKIEKRFNMAFSADAPSTEDLDDRLKKVERTLKSRAAAK